MDDTDMRAELTAIFDAAVAAAHPAHILAQHLPEPPSGRLIILACGKAGASMAAAAEAHYRQAHGLGADRLLGIAVARDGYGCPAGSIEVVEAGHPLPNAAGLDATRRVMALAEGAGADDLVLALISGGGSANWLLPRGAITLADKQAVTKALLRSGAGIAEINTLRKHLSAIKGGRLAAACRPARLATLAISDVPGDDPSVIASGPTVPDASTLEEARAIVARYALDLPAACRAVLDDPASETPKPGDPAFDGSTYRIVSTPAAALDAAADKARALGYEPVLLGSDLEGEARDVAARHAALALEARAAGRRVAILSGGELTVTIRGEGRGGPNQEYALALALELGGAAGIAALSADTDGTDGGTGLASDPAGAFALADTLERASAAGLDPAAFLARNDSTGFFEAIGDLFVPGPTFTNVNDCRTILVTDGPAPGRVP
ncbi:MULTISPECIES: glycerate kinase [unclassified Aureimonas]|uniref:glycerate kinase type-2 family protein n=1 Tax=unclassified Aureimonas TaxID=2615206 RepID=UPI0006F1FE59|nr:MULTISPECIES: glycerate kinase [unclassified Aureimonas]KQT69701.1 hydroxypyruvate reductase [Aureimonas sp. Leaf427]KQT76146.1 hydroxypyruvate reductase [Aureimonas sp. Leaf460]